MSADLVERHRRGVNGIEIGRAYGAPTRRCLDTLTLTDSKSEGLAVRLQTCRTSAWSTTAETLIEGRNLEDIFLFVAPMVLPWPRGFSQPGPPRFRGFAGCEDCEHLTACLYARPRRRLPPVVRWGPDFEPREMTIQEAKELAGCLLAAIFEAERGAW